jgi:hypothetical protein
MRRMLRDERRELRLGFCGHVLRQHEARLALLSVCPYVSDLCL